jgi:thiamine kinase-like enzyme
MKAAEMLPSFAVHWASQLGADPNGLERLHGGINNRVFRCGDGSQKWVIKGYAPVQPGQRDRMQAEQQFLQFANLASPGFTPALIHADPDRRCVVLENLEGKAFIENMPPPAEAIASAVLFFQLLNRDALLARESIHLEAAEGFLSLRRHLANVHERLNGMSCDHLESSTKPIAEALLQLIRHELAQVEERTYRLLEKGLVVDTIHPDHCCISPSDFGFHNAIYTNTGIRFIDFEFAGWDDPAKTILDFSLQPRVPVHGYGSPLLKALQTEHQHSIQIRCQHLGPILRLKWVCIMLSVLNRDRLQYILTVTPEEEAPVLIRKRLHKVISYIEKTSDLLIR